MSTIASRSTAPPRKKAARSARVSGEGESHDPIQSGRFTPFPGDFGLLFSRIRGIGETAKDLIVLLSEEIWNYANRKKYPAWTETYTIRKLAKALSRKDHDVADITVQFAIDALAWMGVICATKDGHGYRYSLLVSNWAKCKTYDEYVAYRAAEREAMEQKPKQQALIPRSTFVLKPGHLKAVTLGDDLEVVHRNMTARPVECEMLETAKRFEFVFRDHEPKEVLVETKTRAAPNGLANGHKVLVETKTCTEDVVENARNGHLKSAVSGLAPERVKLAQLLSEVEDELAGKIISLLAASEIPAEFYRGECERHQQSMIERKKPIQEGFWMWVAKESIRRWPGKPGEAWRKAHVTNGNGHHLARPESGEFTPFPGDLGHEWSVETARAVLEDPAAAPELVHTAEAFLQEVGAEV